MRAVPAVVYRLLGLLHPEWGLRLGPAGAGRRRRSPVGVILEEETRRGTIDGGVPIAAAVRCNYDQATLVAPVLVGRCELSSLRGARLERPILGPDAKIIGCDLAGAQWTGGAAEEAELVACSLRHATLTDLSLGTLELCDLAGAHLEGVDLARALGCDFTGARLVRCGLEGADLRSSRFVRTEFRDCSLEGARVQGADFTGALGLDRSTRRRLVEGGARFHGARLARLLIRVVPGARPLRLHGLVRIAVPAAWTAGLALCAFGLWASLHPPPPVEVAAPPPARDRVPTEEERTRTRTALSDLRTALARAHETMLANGATNRSWPTMVEFQQNHFDLDGDGPGEVMARLLEGNEPQNFLTDSEGGVLPYCNEEPNQETISGVDTDWHYCEQTGRVFAAAGFSGQATLNW